MGAGEDGEGENGSVNRWEIVASAIRDAGGEDNGGDREDLDGRIDFPQHRGSKTAKARDNVDGGGTHEDEDIAADDGDSYPERNRKMRRQRLWKNRPHRQDDKRSHEHQFIGYRVEDRSELRFLIEAASEQTIKAVSNAGKNKDSECEDKPLIEKQGDEYRNQNHPENG